MDGKVRQSASGADPESPYTHMPYGATECILTQPLGWMEICWDE